MEVVRIAQPGGQRADAGLLETMLQRQRKRQSIKTPAVPQKHKNDDWEATGLAGIKKKNLTLDINWIESTWINKTTNFEKLKLLKDDGVDVTHLLKLKRAGQTIARAVIAHITEREQRSQSLQPVVEDSSSVLKNIKDIKETSFNQLFDKPPTSSSRKRKLEDPSAEDLAKTVANLGSTFDQHAPPSKKVCVASVQGEHHFDNMKVENIAKWDELKRHVLTEIFQPSQIAPTVDSCVSPSRIKISFPPRSAIEGGSSDLQLNSSGYECVMDEFRALSDNTTEDGTTISIQISDPSTSDSIGIAVHHTYNVFRNVPLQTIIEGNPVALTALLSRLSTNGVSLTYMEKRFFDSTGARRAKGGIFELSDKTQQELRLVKAALEEGLAHVQDGVEVDVSCVTEAGKKFGKKMDYKKVLY